MLPFNLDPQKLKTYAIGLLILMLTTVAGALASRVRTMSESLKSSERNFQYVSGLTVTASTRITALERELATKASAYARLVAARDAKGDVVFDRDGKPVLESFSGSEAESRETSKELEELRHQTASLSQSNYEKDFQIEQMKKEASGPGFKAYNLAADCTVPDILGRGDWSAADLYLGGGLNFLLGPLTLVPSLLIGGPMATLSKDTLGARVHLTGLF